MKAECEVRNGKATDKQWNFIRAQTLHGNLEAFGTWFDSNFYAENKSGILEQGGYSFQQMLGLDNVKCYAQFGTDAGMEIIKKEANKIGIYGKEIFDKNHETELQDLIGLHIFTKDKVRDIAQTADMDIIGCKKEKAGTGDEHSEEDHMKSTKMNYLLVGSYPFLAKALIPTKEMAEIDVLKHGHCTNEKCEGIKRATDNAYRSGYCARGAHDEQEDCSNAKCKWVEDKCMECRSDWENTEKEARELKQKETDKLLTRIQRQGSPTFNNEPKAGETASKYNRCNRYQFFFAKRFFSILKEFDLLDDGHCSGQENDKCAGRDHATKDIQKDEKSGKCTSCKSPWVEGAKPVADAKWSRGIAMLHDVFVDAKVFTKIKSSFLEKRENRIVIEAAMDKGEDHRMEVVKRREFAPKIVSTANEVSDLKGLIRRLKAQLKAQNEMLKAKGLTVNDIKEPSKDPLEAISELHQYYYSG